MFPVGALPLAKSKRMRPECRTSGTVATTAASFCGATATRCPSIGIGVMGSGHRDGLGGVTEDQTLWPLRLCDKTLSVFS